VKPQTAELGSQRRVPEPDAYGLDIAASEDGTLVLASFRHRPKTQSPLIATEGVDGNGSVGALRGPVCRRYSRGPSHVVIARPRPRIPCDLYVLFVARKCALGFQAGVPACIPESCHGTEGQGKPGGSRGESPPRPQVELIAEVVPDQAGVGR